MYLVQRVQMESLDNYLFFATLTYNRESLPHLGVSSGYDIPFADVHDLQNCFKRIRVHNSFTRPFKYLFVSELGSKRGRPHFHVLFLLPKIDDSNLLRFEKYGITVPDNEFTPYNLEHIMFRVLLENWSRNVGTRKHPVYKPICTYQCIYRAGKRLSNFDLHYVRPYYSEDSFSNVAFYVLKYMLKRSDRETRLQQALRLNLPVDEYESVWKIVRSRWVASKGFGLSLDENGEISDKVLQHIRKGVNLSKDFPKFFNPSSGKSFPLSRYYKRFGKLFSFDDALRFYFDSDSSSMDSPIIRDSDKDYSQLLKSVSDYEKKINEVSDRGDYDSYSNEFD